MQQNQGMSINVNKANKSQQKMKNNKIEKCLKMSQIDQLPGLEDFPIQLPDFESFPIELSSDVELEEVEFDLLSDIELPTDIELLRNFPLDITL